MKKALEKLTFLILLAAMLLSFSVNAAADGNVTYDGNAKEFIFIPGSEYSPSDLFTDFKGLMPGDSVTQKITVDNSIENDFKIRVYLRSLGAEQGSEELLSELKLTVKQDGNSELFNGTADETAQLTEWVCLGTVCPGGKIDLDVTLDVPMTLENRFRDAVGFLNWQFHVEELPVSPDNPKPPQTGDDYNLLFWWLLLGLSAAVIVILFAIQKRKSSSDSRSD